MAAERKKNLPAARALFMAVRAPSMFTREGFIARRGLCSSHSRREVIVNWVISGVEVWSFQFFTRAPLAFRMMVYVSASSSVSTGNWKLVSAPVPANS